MTYFTHLYFGNANGVNMLSNALSRVFLPENVHYNGRLIFPGTGSLELFGAPIIDALPYKITGSLSIFAYEIFDSNNNAVRMYHNIPLDTSISGMFAASAGSLVFDLYINNDYGSGSVLPTLSQVIGFSVADLIDWQGDLHITGSSKADTLVGHSGADSLYGHLGNDVLLGGDGDDDLHGHEGNDSVDGGIGNDVIFGEAGDDTLYGGDGTDQLFGGEDNDSLLGGDGADSLYGEAGGDTIQGGAGSDTLYGHDGSDHLLGDEGDDIIFGDAGADIAEGGIGDDRLYGGEGNDSLSGDAGNDSLYGDVGDDFLRGGAGNDLIDGNENNDTVEGDEGDDRLFGADGNDSISGGSGADSLYGGTGTDTLRGGAGVDVLYGNDGNDILFGDADSDFLSGGAGFDILIGGEGSDTISGGSDIDIVSYATSSAITLAFDNAALSTGDAAGDVIDSSVEIIVASQAADTIYLGDRVHIAFGNGGADSIVGGTGADFVSGDNQISPTGFPNDPILFLLLGQVEGLAGIGPDTLVGGGGADTLLGGFGDDVLIGGTPAIVIAPDNAANLLVGGEGNDTLNGWTGESDLSDTLDGGEGADFYYADGRDRIVEFELAEKAYFATTGPIGSYVVYSPRFGDTTVTFFDSNGIKGNVLGTLSIGNRLLPGQLTVQAPLQTPGLALAEIVHQNTNASFEAQAIANIWANARTEQFKLVAWKLYEEIIGKGAGALFAKRLAEDLADRLFSASADEKVRKAFAGFVESIATETVSTVVTNIAKEEDSVISAADIAAIIAEAFGGLYGKIVSEAISWGPTVAHVIWLEFKTAFDQKVIELFGLPDATGVYQLKSGTNDFVLKGHVVRDYVSGATVFADANSNGILDQGESFTTTDNVGRFTLVNPIGPLVAYGGTDIATRLPLDSVLRASAGATVLSPISTLARSLDEVGFANGSAEVGQILGLEASFDLRSSDVLGGALSGDADAVKAHLFTHALVATRQIAQAAMPSAVAPAEFDAVFYGVFANLVADGTPPDLLNQASLEGLLTQVAMQMGQSMPANFVAEVATVAVGANQLLSDLGNGQRGDAVAAAAAIARTIATEVVPAILMANGDADALDSAEITGAALAGKIAAARTVVAGGTDGADFILGTDLAESLFGLGGNDIIWAAGGSDTVDGGLGTDVAGYGLFRSQVSLQRTSDGSIVVQAGTTGTDTLVGIERIQLNDGSFILDLAGADPALVYRLYQAAFARTPDEGGLRYWASAADQFNLSQLQLATEFRISAEFIAKYGSNVSNRDYTYNMYKNVLGREPDQGGIDYWTNVVDIGWVSRDQLLIEFAQSPENVGLTAPNTTAGYWVV